MRRQHGVEVDVQAPKCLQWLNSAPATGKTAIKIDVLPDDVLLWVFDFCGIDEHWWHQLVHVCRRWRQLILASPRRLNLQLLCTCTTPVRKYLGLWPTIPIAIRNNSNSRYLNFIEEGNILTALEHRDRVRNITLSLKRWQDLAGKVFKTMQEPFPALSHLRLSITETPPLHDAAIVLPDGFLGGDASNLQELWLTEISFPALPTLISSAINLIDLHLCGLSAHVLPETMVSSLAVMTRLELLCIEFGFPIDFDQVPPTSPTRVVLPALTQFQYRGLSNYMEDFVSRIDCPRLKSIIVLYMDELASIFPFQVPEELPLRLFQLIQFIDRTETLKLAPFRHAYVDFDRRSINLGGSQEGLRPSHLSLAFSGNRRMLSQSSSTQLMRELLIQISAMLISVCHLTMLCGRKGRLRDQDIAEWIGLFRLFPAVETLHVAGELAMMIDPVFDQLTGEIVTQVLPVLRFLYMESPVTRPVRQFLTTRKLFGLPVTIVKTRGQLRMLDAARSEANEMTTICESEFIYFWRI